ncbi:hypothetical protein P6F26_00070 [Roseibacterium sp. SDUM158017]|uniref:hypothetical protein n=1 Tax=Roseicyclus salinarum TaxID=3036773 RepID=UPI00241554A3|nr:hypothetical protein [Roseibacterium sp. SDUM158017]MDG4646823.1 hypothetical protein [Roseibacterium sp. SDUM158017]
MPIRLSLITLAALLLVSAMAAVSTGAPGAKGADGPLPSPPRLMPEGRAAVSA